MPKFWEDYTEEEIIEIRSVIYGDTVCANLSYWRKPEQLSFLIKEANKILKENGMDRVYEDFSESKPIRIPLPPKIENKDEPKQESIHTKSNRRFFVKIAKSYFY